jgi:hypothetical protein
VLRQAKRGDLTRITTGAVVARTNSPHRSPSSAVLVPPLPRAPRAETRR